MPTRSHRASAKDPDLLAPRLAESALGSRLLIIDNYDSFTFNLYQALAEITGVEPIVVRNDEPMAAELAEFDGVILSPGPGTPERPGDLGICGSILRDAKVPVLGVCLGHQALGHAFGARIARAKVPMHGRSSLVTHTGDLLFEGIPERFEAVRYHSLVLAPPLPSCLEIIAAVDDLIMGIRHKSRPLWGVQFHPESIGTPSGRRLLENFARRCAPGIARPAPPSTKQRARKPRAEDRPSARLLHRRLDREFDTEAVFCSLFGDSERCFWLDSSLRKSGLSRFSFMGTPAGTGFELRYSVGGPVEVIGADTSVASGELFDVLREELSKRAVPVGELPFDFNCGFVGYLGYELKAHAGGGSAHRATRPDAGFFFCTRLLAFDHEERCVYLVALCEDSDRSAAERWLDETEAALERAAAPPLVLGRHSEAIDFVLRRDRDGYLQDIAHCIEEIESGESYELCLTSAVEARCEVDPLSFYRVLRRRNPAPYAAFLRFADFAIVSASPERFLKIDRERTVESKPIKGTRPRGQSPAEDLALADELRTSEKDRSENLMVVDMVRHDLGRTCEVGSVTVPRLMDVESYASVHQLVTTIRGRLRESTSTVECVRAAFPGGSMTGAPKIRTMQILDRLEAAPRGIYSGALGFFGLGHTADLSIVIRTAIVEGDQVSFGTGGAIVALSDPTAELDEMLLKARALVEALSETVHGRVAPELCVLR